MYLFNDFTRSKAIIRLRCKELQRRKENEKTLARWKTLERWEERTIKEQDSERQKMANGDAFKL